MEIMVVPDEGNQFHHNEEWVEVSNAREKGVEGGNDDGTRKEGSGYVDVFQDQLIIEQGDQMWTPHSNF